MPPLGSIYHITITEAGPVPAQINVPTGAVVRWTVAMDRDDVQVQGEDGKWQSPVLKQGESFERGFSEWGEFPYRVLICGDGVAGAGTVRAM
jgi:hypothetical protein